MTQRIKGVMNGPILEVKNNMKMIAKQAGIKASIAKTLSDKPEKAVWEKHAHLFTNVENLFIGNQIEQGQFQVCKG